MALAKTQFSTLGGAHNVCKTAEFVRHLKGAVRDCINDAVWDVGMKNAHVIVLGKKGAKELYAKLNSEMFTPEPEHSKVLQGYLGEWSYSFHIVSDCYKAVPLFGPDDLFIITKSGAVRRYSWGFHDKAR